MRFLIGLFFLTCSCSHCPERDYVTNNPSYVEPEFPKKDADIGDVANAVIQGICASLIPSD